MLSINDSTLSSKLTAKISKAALALLLPFAAMLDVIRRFLMKTAAGNFPDLVPCHLDRVTCHAILDSTPNESLNNKDIQARVQGLLPKPSACPAFEEGFRVRLRKSG